MKSGAREIPYLKKWLFLKPSSDELSTLVLEVNYNYSSKRNRRTKLQVFHLLLITTYNKGIRQPEKVALHHSAKHEVSHRKWCQSFCHPAMVCPKSASHKVHFYLTTETAFAEHKRYWINGLVGATSNKI